MLVAPPAVLTLWKRFRASHWRIAHGSVRNAPALSVVIVGSAPCLDGYFDVFWIKQNYVSKILPYRTYSSSIMIILNRTTLRTDSTRQCTDTYMMYSSSTVVASTSTAKTSDSIYRYRRSMSLSLCCCVVCFGSRDKRGTGPL